MAAVSEVFLRVQTIMQDKTGVRWPLSELRLWLNDGCREIVAMKPTANVANQTINLVAGTKQTLPGSCIQLIRVVRNMSTGGANGQGRSAIITVPRDLMDSQLPDWHDASVYGSQQSVKHAIWDEADQDTFYVFPPNDGTGHIEVIFCAFPTRVQAQNPAEVLVSYSTILVPLSDDYVNPLVDYMLYRAYLKDNEVAGNLERANAHYLAMANSLGVKVKNELTANPRTTAAQTGLAT